MIWNGGVHSSLKTKMGLSKSPLDGVTSLHSFPQCAKLEDLQNYIGLWQTTRMQYGQGIQDVHLRTMFLNMVPESVASDIRKRPELKTLQSCIKYVLGEIGRYNDNRLATIHAQKIHKAPTNGRKNPVESLLQDEGSESREVPEAASPDSALLNALSEEFDGLVAALSQRGSRGDDKRARSPSALARPGPKFEGCWHCGQKDNSGTKCNLFQKLLEDNGRQNPCRFSRQVRATQEGQDGSCNAYC